MKHFKNLNLLLSLPDYAVQELEYYDFVSESFVECNLLQGLDLGVALDSLVERMIVGLKVEA